MNSGCEQDGATAASSSSAPDAGVPDENVQNPAPRTGWPGRAGAVAASATCFTAIVVALVYALDARWVDTAVLMLAGLGQVIAFLWFRAPWPRAVCSLILLTAAVSAAQQLYNRIWWWDILIHFLAVHALVWMLWNRVLRGNAQLRDRVRDARREPYLLCALAGLSLATAWEIMELLGFLFVTPEIHIPPLDTLLDVTVGVLGAAMVGRYREPR
ncbi:hypothetical protein [Kocuria rhizophila]|uniref:hypothetical protein n=1 Tax=Kocuria rhizophila TaxID=72000 RepID=UPI001EF4740A|nr:hypothetical protein [Kocuria rhizophila]MCG7424111.1 hypothetical protein [Kocuria rhizophila]MCT1880816.1 hypothetical protein [Kocuria rhizophila]